MEGSDDDLEVNEDDTEDSSFSTNCSFFKWLSRQVGNQAVTSTWSTQVNRLNLHDFLSPVGPTVDISSSPMDVFSLFFTQDLLEEIVKETNSYARTVMGAEKYDKWIKVTVEELKAFLGFSILMGINHFLSRNDYWS